MSAMDPFYVHNVILHEIQNRLWSQIIPPKSFYFFASPIFLLLSFGLVVLLLGVFRKDKDFSKPCSTSWLLAVVGSFLAGLFGFIVGSPEHPTAYLGSGVLIDSLSQFSFVLISLGTVVTLMAASVTQVGRQLMRPELLSLMLFASAGLMLMCSAGEFMSFFVGLEIASISLYVLVGYQRKCLSAMEASIKYFLLGATASAFLLMGAALVYASIGSLRFADFELLTLSVSHPFSMLGLLFLMSGLSFKLALAPFHLWGPDVYQGANSHLTGYMASLVKYSVVVVLLRILSAQYAVHPDHRFVYVFEFLGILSIVIGSLLGLVQHSVKRMLAYSSIANAGYFCLAFASLVLDPQSLEAKQALISYAMIYVVLSLGAFSVLAWLEDQNKEDLQMIDLAGLGSKKPAAAFALTVFFFGFAGIPPVAGFFGKFFLLSVAIKQNLWILSMVVIVCSCISLFYYLSVMVQMWFKPYDRYSLGIKQSSETNSLMKILCFVLVLASLLLGILGPKISLNMNYQQASEQFESTVLLEKN